MGVGPIFEFQQTVIWFVSIAVLAVKIFAFVDASLRRPDAYEATGKMNKRAWMLILGLAVLCDLLLGMFLLWIIGIVAAFVYLLDARPALVSITRRR